MTEFFRKTRPKFNVSKCIFGKEPIITLNNPKGEEKLDVRGLNCVDDWHWVQERCRLSSLRPIVTV